MAFLKIDTMGMNARYGRTKVAPEKSRQVTEFNTPSKNRAPYIPKTEAKEGDVFSSFLFGVTFYRLWERHLI